ncbi:Surfactin synthase subunit 2 [Streptomyces sp. ADI92-24]|uniref:condensation domain-containing protein n=1 Tax=Streptomyces sp. ADI92-24 TaxID=1522756 RepID=UPI000FB0BC4F|nr:condensation domain-containing protein [Streptomyces sp. ADI92-24]RPK32925.1 Surfactin synthase subunit 2 [Streptomyces sp. ADI92-24]
MNAPSALKDDDTGELVSMSRVLSPGERWYWIIDQLSTLNICAHVRIKGELSARELRSALGALQDRHPQLRTAIAQTTPGQAGDGPRFVPADRPIPLREVRLTSPDDKRWVSEVDGHELTEPLDWRSGPLARAVLISGPEQTHDLLLTVPHCIADGTTALSLLRRWVRLAAATPAPGRTTAAPGPAPEPFESLFPERFRVGAPALSEAPAADEADTAAAPEVVSRLEPERFVPFDRRRTRMLHRSLTSDVLDELTLACKREGATLHGLLAAALVCAVADDAGAAPLAPFAVGSPVALRDELRRPVSEDEVGCFVSALHSVVRQQPEDLWSMARFIKDDITARKQLGEQYAVFSLLAAQGPTGVVDCEPFVRHFEEHGPFNFFVSNIGRFEFPDELGDWQLSEAQFVGGISVVGYFGSSVTTSHGQLSWNFTYIDGAVSRERAERIVDDTVARVIAAGE